MILTTLQKLPKIIVATGFEWLPKVQKNRPIWSHCPQQDEKKSVKTRCDLAPPLTPVWPLRLPGALRLVSYRG